MRRGIRVVARTIAAANGVTQQGRRLTVVGWHRIDDTPSGLGTDAGVFDEQLDVLDRSGAVVLPLPDAVQRLAAGTLPDRAVALTFDDGYASVFERAWPKLRERGLPATVFVVSGYLDGHRRFPWDESTPDDRARLADADAVKVAAHDGLDIGSHTVSHRWLPHLSDSDLASELLESRQVIEELVQRPVASLAYPVGGWDRRVCDAAAGAGYRIAVTVDRGINRSGCNALTLRRSFAPDSAADFELVLAGGLNWLRPFDRWRMRNGPQW